MTSHHLESAAAAVASILSTEDPESEFIVTVSERQGPTEIGNGAGGVDAHTFDRGDLPSIGAPNHDTTKKAA